VQVGPRGWDQRACAIRQHKHQQQFATPTLPAQHLQRLTLEWVGMADDGHPLGVAVEVVALMMGIVSCLASTPSRTTS
jgi:hypothetical protein